MKEFESHINAWCNPRRYFSTEVRNTSLLKIAKGMGDTEAFCYFLVSLWQKKSTLVVSQDFLKRAYNELKWGNFDKIVVLFNHVDWNSFEQFIMDQLKGKGKQTANDMRDLVRLLLRTINPRHGTTTRQLSLLRTLLTHRFGKDQDSVLHYCVFFRTCRFFSSYGENEWDRELIDLVKLAGLSVLRVRNKLGRTVLHEASRSGQWGLVRRLLRIPPVDPNVVDSEGNTSLHLASSQGHLDTVKELLNHGADGSLRNKYGQTALDVAAAANHGKVTEYLLDSGQFVLDEKPLTHVNDDHDESLNAKSKDAVLRQGGAALHCAAWHGNLPLARRLVKKGFDPSARDAQGNTPLHCAAHQGHAQVVAWLLALRIYADVKDNFGNTPLHFACLAGQSGTAEVLLNYGADLDACNLANQAPIDLALALSDATKGPLLAKLLQDIAILRCTRKSTKRKLPCVTNQRGAKCRRVADESTRIAPVFLSHTGQDETAANLTAVVYESLRDKHKIPTFLDSQCLQPGDDLKDSIQENCIGCQVFVCILSPNYFSRYWCLHELDLACQHGRTIVPVYCRGFAGVPKVDDSLRQGFEQVLEGKLGSKDPVVLDRWCRNVLRLKHIISVTFQGGKHGLTAFRNTVVQHILRKLDEP